MKKITLLIVLLAFFFSWYGTAQIATFPYSEDFESGDGGWVANNGSNGTWALGTPAASVINSAASGVNAWTTNLTGNYNASDNSNVQSPVFDLSSLTAPSIEFSVWWNAEFSWDGMVLQSSVDGGTSWQNVGAFGDPNNWYTDNTINGAPGGQPAASAQGWTGRNSTNNGSGGWVVARHALTGLAGQNNVIFRFAFGSDTSVQDNGVAFDSVSIFEVTCPEPTDLTIASVTSSTANITWTAGGAETTWEVAIQTAGTGVPSGSGDPTTDNFPYVAMGLNPSTNYEVYIRSSCGSEFSPWIGPVNFATECTTFIAPYTEGFENGGTIPLCWTMSGGENWRFSNTGTGNHIGDNGTITGTTSTNGYFAWVDSSGSDAPAVLLSPLVDVSDLANPSITFYEISDNEGNANSTLTVEVFDGAAWNTMATYNTNTVGWELKVINLGSLTITGDIQARFTFSETVATDFYDDIAIDDVTFDELPSCPAPSMLSVTSTTSDGAELSWSENGTATVWNVEIVPSGTAPTGTPTDVGVSNPFTATGLNPATDYDFYVQSDCGGDLSMWVGPASFATECVTFVAPYTEGFENGGTIPLCWTMSGGEVWRFSNTGAGNHIGNNGTITGTTSTNGYFAWVDSSGSDAPAVLVSPLIDISALSVPALSFYELSDNEGNANSTLTVEVYDGAIWNNVGVYNSNTSGWEQKIIDLSPLTVTGDIQVRFTFSETVATDFYDDIAIDDVTIDEAPACIIPSGLIASNITGTTADISWQAGTASAWEYVIQPAGTGVPTGNGTPLTVTTVNETGLSFSTSYEVYIRTDCGPDGYSDWIGPLTFTTTIQTNFTVDCNVGPVNNNFCYFDDIDDDPSVATFVFTSSDGSALNLTFNTGQIESCCDELVVIDSDGTELYNQTVPGGDVAGLTFQSSGDTISFYINSDFSVSCDSGSFPAGIDYTVACATCINPTATYAVVDDCDNGDQFLIDVNITSVGDATNLTISNDFDANTVAVTSVGTYQIGPFPFSTPVTVTISNDNDPNCIINSVPIQVLACPPANDNCSGAIVAVVNPGESCDNVTPGTILAATPSGVPPGSCTGNPNDDVWFQFTAIGTQQIIQLQNFSGGTTNLDHAVYSGVCGSLVELYCSTDNFSVTPSLTVGNTYYVRVFSAGSAEETTNFDLCIQTLGNPTYCLDALPICASDLVYPSITGDDVAPPYLDYGCLGSEPDPTWNAIYFDIAGDYTFTLAQIGDDGLGNDIDFIVWGPFTSQQLGCYDLLPANIADCSYSAVSVETIELTNVQAGDVYIILITNFSQQSGTYTFTQASGPSDGTNCSVVCDVVVDYQDTEIVEDINNPGFGEPINLCGFDSITLTANSPYADFYEWYQDGFAFSNDETVTITESGVYQVLVNGDVCDGNSFSLQIPVILGEEPVANSVPDLVTCDDASGDGVEQFDLESQTASVLGGQDATVFGVTYHLSQDDANSGTGALSSPYTNTSNPQTIYVRVEDSNAPFCIATTSFDLVISGPTPTVTSVDYNICDDSSNDGFAEFDLTSQNILVLGTQSASDFTVSYYLTESDADNGTGPLSSPYINVTNPQVVWVRIESNVSSSCYGVGSINLIVDPAPMVTGVPDLERCDSDGDGLADFDLTTYESDLLDGQTGLTVTYHTSLADAEGGDFAIPTPVDYSPASTPVTIYVRVESGPDCYNTTSFELREGDEPLTTITTLDEFQVCPDATVPVVITAVPGNYDLTEVSVAWYQDGVLVPGETGLDFPVLVGGYYEVEVTFNETGCSATVGQDVVQLDNCIIPQGISPDGDGLNDTFDLSNFNVQRLEIFNRLGKLVYSRDNYVDEWHGQTDGGDELPVGTYFYTMVYEGGAKTKSAWVYLNK